MLNEEGKITSYDPYKGKTYSHVITLVDVAKLYYEEPHPLLKVPGSGQVWWNAEQGRWTTEKVG